MNGGQGRMGDKSFTVREIAEQANTKFKLNLGKNDFEAVMKRIRREINDKVVKSEGTKIVSRTEASLYSEITKDNLLNTWLFNYFLDKSNDEKVKKFKPNDYYENKIAERELAKRVYFESTTNEDYKKMYESNIDNGKVPIMDELEFKNRKMEIMLEAIFNKYFELDEKKLHFDLMNSYLTSYDIDLSAGIMRSLEELEDNSNYYTKK